MRQRPFLLLALTVAVIGLTGCFGEDEAGVLLLDGTPAREAPVELEGVEGDAILTATTVVPVASLEPGTFAHSCVEAADTAAEGSAVMRVGVASESVTAREAGGRGLQGCDNTRGPREGDRPWCGSTSGQLSSGRVSDPRLDILCTTSDGTPVAFAWFDVSEKTRFLAVNQVEYVEIYEVAADLPVRVATVTEVNPEESRATFDLSEHDADGRLLRRERVELGVAG